MQNEAATMKGKKCPAGENGEGKNNWYTCGRWGKLLKAFYEIVIVRSGNSKNTHIFYSAHSLWGMIPLGIKTLMHKDKFTKYLFQLYLYCQKKKWKLTGDSPRRERNNWINCGTFLLSIIMQLLKTIIYMIGLDGCSSSGEKNKSKW